MNNKIYTPRVKNPVVAFKGRNYGVITQWETVQGSGTYTTYAIAEGEQCCNGMFPAVKVEAFACDDGSWDVIGVEGPELVDETGGGYGDLAWSEETGVVMVLLNGEKRKV